MKFENLSVDLPELLAAARTGADTVRLGDGSVGLLPERWLERCGLLASLAQQGDEGVRFANSQAFLLDALLASVEGDLELDPGFTPVPGSNWRVSRASIPGKRRRALTEPYGTTNDKPWVGSLFFGILALEAA